MKGIDGAKEGILGSPYVFSKRRGVLRIKLRVLDEALDWKISGTAVSLERD